MFQPGASTKALLDALTDPAADLDRKGLVSASGLAHYVATRVASLTEGAQTPGMEIRFNGTAFATGLRAEAGRALNRSNAAWSGRWALEQHPAIPASGPRILGRALSGFRSP